MVSRQGPLVVSLFLGILVTSLAQLRRLPSFRQVAQAMLKMGRCQGFTLGLTTDYKLGARGRSWFIYFGYVWIKNRLVIKRGWEIPELKWRFIGYLVSVNVLMGFF